MRKVLIILLVSLVAGVFSHPLMSTLMDILQPRNQGLQLVIVCWVEPFSAYLRFEFWIFAGVALVGGAIVYLKGFSLINRLSLVLLPMFAMSASAIIFKTVEFSDGNYFGQYSALSMQQAALYQIPAIGFFSGAVAVVIAWLRRNRELLISSLIGG